jgi:hypothetical protein
MARTTPRFGRTRARREPERCELGELQLELREGGEPGVRCAQMVHRNAVPELPVLGDLGGHVADAVQRCPLGRQNGVARHRLTGAQAGGSSTLPCCSLLVRCDIAPDRANVLGSRSSA